VSNQKELPQPQKFAARHCADHPQESAINFIGFESPLQDFSALAKNIIGKDKQVGVHGLCVVGEWHTCMYSSCLLG
jgi:hypothetical protein